MIHIQDGPIGLNDPNRRVFAGVWDTKNAASVQFDVSEWLTAWPGGTLRILVQRPGDEIPYPAQGVQLADGVAEWTFDAVDTAVPGVGSCALIYETGDFVRARTEPYDLLIAPSLGPESETPPDPLQRWYDEIIAAQGAAEAAQAGAEAAQGAAEAAQTTAETAAGAAASARSGAEAAQGAAEAAQTAAETAAGAATSARSGAEAAQGAAEAAQTAAETAAGAATSARSGAEAAQTAAEAAQTTAESAESNAAASAAAAAASAASIDPDALKAAIYASFPTDSVSNVSVASFPDGADDIPVKALTVNITPAQSGSGDPSPTNIRPISGWDGAHINRTKTIGVTPNPNCAWASETATLRVTGRTIRRDYIANTASNDKFVSAAALNQALTGYNNLPAGKYAFRGEKSSSRNIGDIKAVLAKSGASDIQVILNGAAVDVPDGYSLNRIIFTSTQFVAGDWTEVRNFVLAVEPEVYSVSWQTEAGTVYGGTLTDNGDGTWDLEYSPGSYLETNADGSPVRDGVVQSWSRNMGNNYIYATANQNLTVAVGSSICSMYKNQIVVGTDNNKCSYVYRSSNNSRIAFRDTSLAEWSTWMNSEITTEQFRESITAYFAALYAQGIKFQMAWRLESPSHLTLTAESVRTLLGDNNIFADCGDVVELTYRADTALYIEKKIAEVTP